MNTKLVIVGLNIVVISALVAVYGAVTGDVELLGLSLSTSLIGLTMLVYGTSHGEVGPEFLTTYLKTLVESTTLVLETLDLLDGYACGVVGLGENTLVVFSKTTTACNQATSPGLGFVGASPYYAIPVSALPDVQSTEGLDSKVVEDALSHVLVSELGVCRSVKVSLAGNIVEVFIAGIPEIVREYTKYPPDPITILTVASLAKITKRSVLLIERISIPGGARLVLRLA